MFQNCARWLQTRLPATMLSVAIKDWPSSPNHVLDDPDRRGLRWHYLAPATIGGERTPLSGAGGQFIKINGFERQRAGWIQWGSYALWHYIPLVASPRMAGRNVIRMRRSWTWRLLTAATTDWERVLNQGTRLES